VCRNELTPIKGPLNRTLAVQYPLRKTASRLPTLHLRSAHQAQLLQHPGDVRKLISVPTNGLLAQYRVIYDR